MARYGFLQRGRFAAGAAPMVTSSGMAAKGTTDGAGRGFPGTNSCRSVVGGAQGHRPTQRRPGDAGGARVEVRPEEELSGNAHPPVAADPPLLARCDLEAESILGRGGHVGLAGG